MQLEGTEELKSEAGWILALYLENVRQLSTLLAEEPRLVNIRAHGSFNVLHLAVRNDWYGLVLQIAEIFSPCSDPSRLPVLQPEMLRDLLIEKENQDRLVTSRSYKSGLDVFAMACINCHLQMNSLLFRLYRFCAHLFDEDHPYCTELISRSPDPEYSGGRYPVDDLIVELHWANPKDDHDRNPHREKLIKICETIWPDLIQWFRLERAPNMVSSLASAGDLSELPSLVVLWMVESPFLPLSEYMVLKLCERRGNLTYSLDDYLTVVPRFKDEILQYRGEIPFVKYLLTIHDTRRTVFHYLVVHGGGELRFLLDSFLDVASQTRFINRGGASLHVGAGSDFITELRSCFSMLDSSGRTALDVWLASPTRAESPEGLEEKDLLSIFRVFQPFDLQIKRGPPNWQWSGKDVGYEINYKAVHDFNGLFSCDSYRVCWEPLLYTAAAVVISSPHYGNEERLMKMKLLLDFPEFLPHGFYNRPKVQGGCNDLSHAVESLEHLTPLQHAVLMGDSAMVRLLAKDNRAYDPARFKNRFKNRKMEGSGVLSRDRSALHVAAGQGSPEMIRIFLDSGAFDSCYRDDRGDTALHSAAHSSRPVFLPVMLVDFVRIPKSKVHAQEFYLDRKGLQTVVLPVEQVKQQEARYRGCLSMLLQAGVDIWQVNDENEVASLHEGASPEYSLWWYDKLDSETLQQTTKLTSAANAMSVTAALVATASYIGPLQPPLGYGSDGNDLVDKVQADFLSVRVFIVCNTLGFYLALVAIMLSLTPSLPMPQESMLVELKRIRRSVTLGLVSLIMAVVTILIAFASASIAVIPKSWNDEGLTWSTLGLGGLMCLVVLALCIVRALRLMFHESHTIREFYRRWVYI
ncbi:hypothetical protein R1sor_022204 [Riccia sorocarpa]|uniref:PGG domain-containing protein n=1 Tax=Riccia sorocarpa TaxID=122646 RepID=A0ABD3GJ76_9MARC